MKKVWIVVVGVVVLGLMFGLGWWVIGGGRGVGGKAGVTRGAGRDGASATAPEGQGRERAAAGKSGWVRVTGGVSGDNEGTYVAWDTRTGTLARRTENGFGITASLENFVTGEAVVYRSMTGMIYKGHVGPPPAGPVRADWVEPMLTYGALLKGMESALGKGAVKANAYGENGVDCHDLEVVPSDFARAHPQRISYWGDSAVPATVRVDPATDLIQEVTLASGRHRRFAYDVAAVERIYDMDVPRDAKVQDNRPTAETIGVYERVMARAAKPIPDGVMVREEAAEGEVGATLWVYGRAGERWTMRLYTGAGKEGGVQMPARWEAGDGEELWGRLAGIYPGQEWEGDGKRLWMRLYDKQTGEVYWNTGAGANRVRVPGSMEYTGLAAEAVEANLSLRQWFFPTEAPQSRWSAFDHLEVVTAADRPGLAGLRTTTYEARSPETALKVQTMNDEWVDPAHNDRAVAFIEQVADGKDVRRREFGEYAALPDGWSYPTWETQVEEVVGADGQKKVMGGKTMARTVFFAGRKMPGLPKGASQPGTAGTRGG